MPSMTDRKRLRVTVPGSTSNLGPGFDLFGLALQLELRVSCTPLADGSSHELGERTGTASDWPDTPDNLLFTSCDRIAREHGAQPIACRFDVSSEIPLARGLGSSGAACAAGLLLGNALYAEKHGALSQDRLVELGVELEGHPENATASLLGGAVLCLPESSGKVHLIEQPLDAFLTYVVAWPDTAVTTQAAREVLPPTIPYADAMENPRRLALLLEGLRTGSRELLAAGVEDRLHVPYRISLIPSGAEALEAARSAGAYCATISGSGSALFAITPESANAAVCKAFAETLGSAASPAFASRIEVATKPPRVEVVDA